MAPPKATAKKAKAKGQKKEKLFHPQSRKADQLVRAQHRQSKLVNLAKSRKEKHGVHVDIFSFFYATLPAEGVLSTDDLHSIIRDLWLPRFDTELEEEKAARRKGRPKSVREQKIEEIKLREAEEYRTGLEVLDLTHSANVELFRRWDQKEAAYVQQLRFIRISSSNPKSVAISRTGKHPSLVQPTLKEYSSAAPTTQEIAMEDDEAPLLLEPSNRFSSTMMTMDT